MDFSDLEFGDTKSLRKNMFICHCDSEARMLETNIRRMQCINKTHYFNQNSARIAFENSLSAFSGANNQALQSADILENIAVHLTREELLNCRLVCKLWSNEMGGSLFRRKYLVVSDPHCSNAEAMIKKRLQGNPISLYKLCLFDISAKCVLYKRLFVTFGKTLSSIRLEECLLSPADLAKLLVQYAPNIQNLFLREDLKANSRRVSTFLQVKSQNGGQLALPNLKVLHWNEVNGRTHLKDVAETCPNLTKLELRCCPPPRLLPKSFANLSWNSLQHLFLSPMGCLRTEHCVALTQLNLRLKKLTLFSLNPTDKLMIKALGKFLSTLSGTLETLELWLDYVTMLEEPRSEVHSPFPVHLPQLKRLHTETLILCHVNHLNHFPTLAEIEVVSNSFDEQRGIWTKLTKRSALETKSTLNTLRCGDVDSKSLNKMLIAFPNITKLRLYSTHVDDSFLRSVIKNLPLLVDLAFTPCTKSHTINITDSGITGVPKKLCTKFRRGNQNKLLEEADINSMKTQPGIGDLKLLHTLDLGHQCSEISDVSIFLSISTLPKLCTLKLPVCKITDASLDVIEKRMRSLLFFGIAGCTGISKEALENFKKRRNNIIIDNQVGSALKAFLQQ